MRRIRLVLTHLPERTHLNISAPLDALKTPLAIANRAISEKSTMPVLRNVLLTAKDGTVTLQATDTEVGLTLNANNVEITEEGECLLPPTFFKTLTLAPDGSEVKLEVTKKELKWTAGGKYTAPFEDTDTFPRVPENDNGNQFEATAAILSRAIRMSKFAAADEQTKYAMQSVCWDVGKNGTVHLVATDGKGLASVKLDCSQNGEPPHGSLLIPPRALEILSFILADLDPSESVGVRFMEQGKSTNSVIFTTKAGSVWSKLVEGRFPPWRDVIPKKSTMTIPIDPKDFLSSIKRAKVMTDAESIRVKFNFESNKVVLNANAQLGSSEVVHALDWTGDNAIEISFDPAYLLSFLSTVDSPIELKLADGQKSGVFEYDGGDSIYLVVPLV